VDEPHIRGAALADVPNIKKLIEHAYGHYVDRLGHLPAPMTHDYRQLVGNGIIWVLEIDNELAGMVALRREPDHLLVGNVAVAKARQGRGLGRMLMEFAERYARREGIEELRLYTNVLMHENQAIYARLGWEEYARGEQDGFHRVFMRKRLQPREEM
jgi:GNAT superfamily N-acetyltransferase